MLYGQMAQMAQMAQMIVSHEVGVLRQAEGGADACPNLY